MIFVFVGKSASGKTFLANEISKIVKLENNIGFTTRPMRVGEIHGVHNFFITEEEMEAMGNDIVCKKTYYPANGEVWIYGMSLKSIETDKNYVMILDPQGARELKDLIGCAVKIIYIEVPDDIRRERAYGREMKTLDPEIERRFKADVEDFLNFEQSADVVVRNINKDYALVQIEDFMLRNQTCECGFMS